MTTRGRLQSATTHIIDTATERAITTTIVEARAITPTTIELKRKASIILRFPVSQFYALQLKSTRLRPTSHLGFLAGILFRFKYELDRKRHEGQVEDFPSASSLG